MVKPDTLSGVDYLDGVKITNGVAEFKIKIIALSSQHDNRNFRFQICILFPTKKTEIVHSCSFRTLSKMNRKRKVSSDVETRYDHDLFDLADSCDLNDIIFCDAPNDSSFTEFVSTEEELYYKQLEIHDKQKLIVEKLKEVNAKQMQRLKHLHLVDMQENVYTQQDEIESLLKDVDEKVNEVELKFKYATNVLSPLSD